GQVTHVILTRSPLIHPLQAGSFIVRLACVKHAASVHPEPGSNSPLKNFKRETTTNFLQPHPAGKTGPHGTTRIIEMLLNPWQFRSHLHGVQILRIPINIWYQQTWYAIEFSSYGRCRHHQRKTSESLRSNFSKLPSRLRPVNSAYSLEGGHTREGLTLKKWFGVNHP